MDKLIEKLRSEPVMVIAFVSAVLTMAAAFGLHLSPEQTGALVAVVNAGLALVARRKVSPADPTGPQDPEAL